MNEEFNSWLKQRPSFRTLRQWNPSLIPLIIERHPTPENKISGFIQRIITGDPGYGKSTFCYKLMAKLSYTINGYTKLDDEEDAYKFALENLIYSPNDLFERVMKQRDLAEPAWIWTLDDASVHMGRQLFDQDRQTYRKLQGIVPTLREDVTCLLITTPATNLLAKPFREFFKRKVEMTLAEGGMQHYTRLGKHYEKRFYPDDIRFRIHNPFNDKFSCLVPEPFYSWYLAKKRKALKDYAISIVKRPTLIESNMEEGELPEDTARY
jgi:hypothetical protein